jgi:hypothetical protein
MKREKIGRKTRELVICGDLISPVLLREATLMRLWRWERIFHELICILDWVMQ